jgi:hypothetical protein
MDLLSFRPETRGIQSYGPTPESKEIAYKAVLRQFETLNGTLNGAFAQVIFTVLKRVCSRLSWLLVTSFDRKFKKAAGKRSQTELFVVFITSPAVASVAEFEHEAVVLRRDYFRKSYTSGL